MHAIAAHGADDLRVHTIADALIRWQNAMPAITAGLTEHVCSMRELQLSYSGD